MEIAMKKRMLLFAVLGASSLAMAADTYTIDGAHTSANFAVKHLGLSTVHGRFTEVSGTILLDEKAPENGSVTAVIKAASVNTDNTMRDKDLRSDNFFNTDKYPEIRFQSTSIKKVGGDKYVAVGKLTIRDVSREVEIPFTLAQGKAPNGTPKLGVDAALTINRFDYRVNFDQTGMLVGKDVNIELSVEAAK
jgi:polyisoprenoid-binding protein YceI